MLALFSLLTRARWLRAVAGSSLLLLSALTPLSAADTAPIFATSPASQAIATGSTVVFSAVATGTPAPGYQWFANGTRINGATDSILIVRNATAANAGTYTCDATNFIGTQHSAAATLTVNTVAASDVGRLINLSILAHVGAGGITLGAVLGPGGSTGGFPIIARAIGPSLAAFKITDGLPNPTLEVDSSSSPPPIAFNEKWGGSPAMAAAFASVGAFPLADPNSLDSAYVPPSPGLTLGNYTMIIADKHGASGTVLAEIYDASAATRTATSPRLINLSTITYIDPGTTLTVGFVIGGTTARTVLLRGVGPTLGAAPFSIGGTMADPQLALFDAASHAIVGNDNWGGGAPLVSAADSVGAFRLAGATTKDAVLLLTLPPGTYSAQLNATDGGGGLALVEIYEVP